MEEKLRQLEQENRRLKEALSAIAAHHAAIGEQLEDIRELLESREAAPSKVTDDDLRSLLKKYSRL